MKFKFFYEIVQNLFMQEGDTNQLIKFRI